MWNGSCERNLKPIADGTAAAIGARRAGTLAAHGKADVMAAIAVASRPLAAEVHLRDAILHCVSIQRTQSRILDMDAAS